ncbi:unnamed protein product [Protopolystoma xenopodis]|uniref:Uncharacterized protein n=1 Tax=Protopolystoma xenopodis TaxID=117903 RepID=A0A3S5AKW3_9PLAT|nr:unnamed protein product [Protopolystoma xenopodis]
MGWVGSALKASAAYLPHQVSEVFAQDRSFAWARVPMSGPAVVSSTGQTVGGGGGPGSLPSSGYGSTGSADSGRLNF